MSLKGTPWNPNPAAGEMAAHALSADMSVPMLTPATVPRVLVAAAPVDRAASRVHQEGLCAEIRIQHELSWLHISDDERDGTCAH